MHQIYTTTGKWERLQLSVSPHIHTGPWQWQIASKSLQRSGSVCHLWVFASCYTSYSWFSTIGRQEACLQELCLLHNCNSTFLHNYFETPLEPLILAQSIYVLLGFFARHVFPNAMTFAICQLSVKMWRVSEWARWPALQGICLHVSQDLSPVMGLLYSSSGAYVSIL